MAANNRHLKKKGEFQNIRIRGKKYSSTTWLLISYKKNDLGFLRFGLTISSKVANSVVRNRLKRWSKEFFRNSPEKWKALGIDINVIFKQKDKEFFKNIQHSEVDNALRKFFEVNF